ncbi:cyclic nucleotide-binding domain-containing protein [Pseudomonas tritici]|uniref:cyclic nucleotide-binding domain-containing protein n=1 Tax=Pseudomonas tritici TaxID=2745518 RepID=UPI00387B2F03
MKKRDIMIPFLESPKCLFLVVKGCLRVALSNSESDGVVCINHLKPGDMFGEQGLFDIAPMQLATASVQARCDAHLLCITHDDLRSAAAGAPSIYTELSSHINTRLGETTEKLLQLLFMDLEQRTYQSLVEITKLPDAITHPDGTLVSLTRIELGQMVGVNRESAGRALRGLKDKGLIEATGSQIVVRGIRNGEPLVHKTVLRPVCA